MSDSAPCTPITITHWPSVKDTRAPRLETFADFPELVRALVDSPAPSWTGELTHPGFTCGVYPAHRSKDGCTAVTLFAVEHDAGTISIDEAWEFFDGMGWLVLIYASKSWTEDKPRWRAFIVPSRPMTVAERDRLWLGWGIKALEPLDLASGESRNAVMFWYAPSLPPGGVLPWRVVEGDPIDVDALLEHLDSAPVPSSAPVEPPPLGAVALPTSSRYGITALENAYKELCATGVERHGTLARVAFKIGGLVGSNTVSYHEAEQALQQGVRVMFASCPDRIERDGYRTIRDQLARGQLEPLYPPARYATPNAPRSAQPMQNARATSTETVWSAGPQAPAIDHAARLIELLSSPTALSDAFDSTVIEHAAHLAPLCKEFQAAVVLAKAAGVGLRDWKKAVAERRAQLEQDRKGQALASQPDAPEAIAQIRAGIDAALLRAAGGKLRATPANAMTIFARDPRVADCFAYQAMADRVVLTRSPEWHADDAAGGQEPGPADDTDVTRAQCWLAREWGLDLGFQVVAQAVEACARRQWIDPLKDYFSSLQGAWDGQPRLASWLAVYMGAVHTVYTAEVGARWMISAVARALQAGCKADYALVFEGGQSAGKSSAIEALAPERDLFFDDEIKIGTKEAAETIRGKWIIELGELSALSKSDLESTKAFITRRVDTYRPSFGRYSRDFKRRCIFAGSTNQKEYLVDATGNRRWWPVRCEAAHAIDLQALKEDRDQLWAEALHLYQHGAEWWIERGSKLEALCIAEQSQREKVHPWTERIEPWLAEQQDKADVVHHTPRHPSLRCPCVACSGVTTGAILALAVGLETNKQTDHDAARVSGILRSLGWEQAAQRRQDGQRVRPFWPSGATLAQGALAVLGWLFALSEPS